MVRTKFKDSVQAVHRIIQQQQQQQQTLGAVPATN